MTRHIRPEDWGMMESHRLWDWVGSRSEMHKTYFTYSAGDGIIGFLKCAGLLRGNVLDYGCGAGFLTEKLIAAGVSTFAADHSRKSIDEVESRLRGKPGWCGAKLIEEAGIPFPDNSFDLITCIETIEHVPTPSLTSLIQELRRVLKPGGTLLLTTPNDENLADNMNYCPFCDTEFHRWQHLRSWNRNEVTALVQQFELDALLVQATDFSNFQSEIRLPEWRAISIGILRDWLNFAIMQTLDHQSPRPFPQGREFRFRFGNGQGPHLCAVATKPIASDSE